MELQLDRFTIRMQEGQSCSLLGVREDAGVAKYDFQFRWTAENAARDDEFHIRWQEEVPGVMYKWDATCRLGRDIAPHWDDAYRSMLSSLAPVSCYFDGCDCNRHCWALSECGKLVTITNGFLDIAGTLMPQFSFHTRQYTNQYETQITLYIDKRPVPMRKAVEDVADWWAEELGMTPLSVPAAAREPLYSFWYSYHQNVNEKAVEDECRRAKALGFEICIVDDGWQTEDTRGGYAWCGDWQPAAGKFPDMAAHVKRVHDIGMKYILWYSVPLIGYHSAHYEQFRDMLLRDEPVLSASLLDPRYKEAREFMIATYKKALLEWDLDGFKLDFIDTWTDSPDNAPYNERMDIPALQDAVAVCMTEIVRQLRQIKPDILLEFRQGYIGPRMKQYGNLFRVSDCAGDYLKNRASILDMRMIMGDQAVHSDKLMLPPFEDPRINALQIISCMFGVLQFSGRLDRLNERTLQMSRFWLSFLKEHRTLLQSRELETHEAHLLYTWAQAVEGNECAVGVYAMDKCIRPAAKDTIYIANGCMGERLFVELAGAYRVQIFNCFGVETACFEKTFADVECLRIPVGGLAVLKK